MSIVESASWKRPTAAIVQARECSDLSFLSPLHRMRAEILAGAARVELAAVETELRQAFGIARSQGAETFAAEARACLQDLAVSLAGSAGRRTNQAAALGG
jgi:hypothetical protein